MTTENNFTETAKTFQENIAKGMERVQDINNKVLETQMKLAADLYSNVLETSREEGTNKLNSSINASSKVMNELFQENMEMLNDFIKKAMKTTNEFIQVSDDESVTNEMKKQLENFNEQVADLAILNQTTLVTALKQFETTVKSFAPVKEQLKKEFEKTAETNQTIHDSYSAFTASSAKAATETLEKLNDSIITKVNAGYKLWSEMMNPSASTIAKAPKSTANNKLVKIAANGNETSKKVSALI